jgi:hypothetical protein
MASVSRDDRSPAGFSVDLDRTTIIVTKSQKSILNFSMSIDIVEYGFVCRVSQVLLARTHFDLVQVAREITLGAVGSKILRTSAPIIL